MPEQNSEARNRMKRRLMAQRARSGYRFKDPAAIAEKYRRPSKPPPASTGRPSPFAGEGGRGGTARGSSQGGVGGMSGNARGNDLINRAVGQPLQGSNPGRGFQFAVNNAGLIGSAAGQATGMMGLGLVGRALRDRYWQNNQWQSPAGVPPTGNDMINDAIDGRSSPMTGEGRGNRAGTSAWGGSSGGGGWYYDQHGALRFSRSGHRSRTSAS